MTSEKEFGLVKAKYSFKGETPEQLSFKEGDKIRIMKSPNGSWWYGMLHKKRGWFPSNRVVENRLGVQSLREAKLTPCSKTAEPAASSPMAVDRVTLSNGSGVEKHYRTAYKNVILSSLLDSEIETDRQLTELLDILRRESWFSQDETSEIEEILRRLIQAHVMFSQRLNENMRKSMDMQQIGGAFTSLSSVLSPLLIRYCRTHVVIIERLRRIRETSTSIDQTERTKLETWLSRPIRQLESYSWILRELIDRTDELSPEREEFERAIFANQHILKLCVALRVQTELQLELSAAKINGWQGENLDGSNIIHISTVETVVGNFGAQLYWIVFLSDAILVLSKSSNPDAYRLEKKININGGKICAKLSSVVHLELTSESIDKETAFCLLYFDPTDFDHCGTLLKSVIRMDSEDIDAARLCSILQDESGRLRTNVEHRNELSVVTSSSVDDSMHKDSPSDTRSRDVRRRMYSSKDRHDGTDKRNRSRTRSRSPKRRRSKFYPETVKYSSKHASSSRPRTVSTSTQYELRTVSKEVQAVSSSTEETTQCDRGETRPRATQTDMVTTIGDSSSVASKKPDLFSRSSAVSSSSMANIGAPVQQQIDNGDSAYRQRIKETIIIEKPNVRFSDVAGLDDAKRALSEAVIFPTRFPQLFKEIEPWKGILLYGPPGTGKSHLAKALANEAGDWTFFSVSVSSLLSKWHGESERMIKELFTQAREKKPSIVFVDEIDSLCSARNDNESEASRRIKTEFMVQLQGVGTKMDNVLMLGATNIPWVLDPAMRRRFERRIYVPLPEFYARIALFKMYLKTDGHSLTDIDYQRLATGTEGFSGADINIIVRDTKMQRIRLVQTATHFKLIPHPKKRQFDKFSPCKSDDPTAIRMMWEQVPPEKLQVPVITLYDVWNSVKKCKRSVNEKDLERLLEFKNEK